MCQIYKELIQLNHQVPSQELQSVSKKPHMLVRHALNNEKVNNCYFIIFMWHTFIIIKNIIRLIIFK